MFFGKAGAGLEIIVPINKGKCFSARRALASRLAAVCSRKKFLKDCEAYHVTAISEMIVINIYEG